ncbi:LysR family transcriptional regulator [Microbacterium sp. UMB0228]|nr:LysR family transcriptional regulator [Microbacterium sp. UMB0228]
MRRSVHGSSLTDTGRMIVELGGAVLEASRRLEAGLQAQQPVRHEQLGDGLRRGHHQRARLPPQRLHAVEPPTAVRLIAGSSSRVSELVRGGDAHLGFVEGPTVDPRLSSLVVAEDELVVVVAPDHPWAGTTIEAQELAETALLVREPGSGTRATLEQWLSDRGLGLAAPAAVLETTGIIHANARAGLAPAVMSVRSVQADVASGALVRVSVSGPPLTRAFRAVWRDLPPAGATLVSLAR